MSSLSHPDPTPTETPPLREAPPPLTRAGERARRRWLLPLVIYALHLGLVVYACPRRVLFGGEPVMGIDYQTHYEQTRTLSEALARFGATWAYDPDLLAGVPVGLAFEVDTRAHALFTHGLTRLGVQQTTAFNLFALLAHLLVPLCVWLAARLLRTGFRAEMITLALAVLLWHFDSTARWCWWAGMLSFAIVGFASPLVLALFTRELDDRRWRFLIPLALLLPLLILTHVWAFATLVVPMVALYLHRFRRLEPVGHLRVWGIALFTIAANLFWLWPALRRINLLALSGTIGQANPLYLLADYFDIFVNPLHTGSVATRSSFRLLAVAGAVVTLWHWRRTKDPRLAGGVWALGWLLGLTYFASLVPILRETEPYRFIVPAVFTAAVYAGPSLERLFDRAWLRELGPVARLAFILLGLLVIPRLAQHVMYFIPELTMRPGGPGIAKPNISGPRALAPTTEFQSYRHDGVPDDYREVADFLSAACRREPGRVVVEWWVLAEYLRWATPCPIVGGFPDRRMLHQETNLFRYKLDQRYYGSEFNAYLRRYNIRHVIITNPYVELERRRELLEPKRWLGYHRIYRVKQDSSYIDGGQGEVHTSLNRIEVERAKPSLGTQSLVLRFHYLDELRCRPGCELRRQPVPHDSVGFIKVIGAPTLPERFIVENSYRP